MLLGGDDMTIYTVKQARLLAGKTQEETADYLGIHKQTYAKLERDPTLITIGQATMIAEFYTRNIDEIAFFYTETQQCVE